MTNLPPTLEGFTAYQDTYYRQLKQLPYFSMIAPVIESFLCRIVSEGAFYLRVHATALEPIIRSGQIKSMMETGTGATMGGPSTRRTATEALFGCDASRLQPAHYPKYGYLSLPDAATDLVRTTELAYQYGHVAFKLKKERLMQRTTLCIGNSLNAGRFHTLIPTLASRIRATCASGLPHHETAQSRALGTLPDPLACYGLMAVEIMENRLTPRNFPAIDRLLGDKIPAFEHFELQYHGQLNLTTDVECVTAAPWFDGDLPLLEAAQKQLAEMNIKMSIYQ